MATACLWQAEPDVGVDGDAGVGVAEEFLERRARLFQREGL